MSSGSNIFTLATEVTNAIRKVVGSGTVGLHEPRFTEQEHKYLEECLDSTFVSSVGKFVDRFESDLAKYTGANHVIVVVNGTAALHIALKLAGVINGDEVLVPALTFVATANAVAYCGATPHFFESDERSLGVAVAPLREYLRSNAYLKNGKCFNKATGSVIRALVVMHTFGHPVDIDGALSVAQEFRLSLVEDAAESLGSRIRGQHTGTFGLFGTLSFNGNKIITTGGGGAILTNDSELARRAKHITTTAKVAHQWRYLHDEVGYNYRMPNLNAALGCAQLEMIEIQVVKKHRLFERYREAFSSVPGVNILGEENGNRSNYWLQTLILDVKFESARDLILMATHERGISTRPAWEPMHQLEPYRRCPRMPLPVAESLARRIINLPSSSFL